MDFETICKERCSTRDFSDKKADEKAIGRILEMIRFAPTALNRQPYKIFIVDSEEGIERLEKSKAVLYHAKTVLIISSDRANAWANRYSGETDGADRFRYRRCDGVVRGERVRIRELLRMQFRS